MGKPVISAEELFMQLGLHAKSRKVRKHFKCPPGVLSEADAAEWDKQAALGKVKSRYLLGRWTAREIKEQSEPIPYDGQEYIEYTDPLDDPWNYDPLLLPPSINSSAASSTQIKTAIPKEQVNRKEAEISAKIKVRRKIMPGK